MKSVEVSVTPVCKRLCRHNQRGHPKEQVYNDSDVCVQGGAADIISVNMGEPRLLWNEVPVRDEVDTLHCGDKVSADGLTDCACECEHYTSKE